MDDSCILILIQKSVCFSSYFQFISNHVFNSLDKKKKKEVFFILRLSESSVHNTGHSGYRKFHPVLPQRMGDS